MIQTNHAYLDVFNTHNLIRQSTESLIHTNFNCYWNLDDELVSALEPGHRW